MKNPAWNECEDSLADAIVDAMSMANVRKLYIEKGKQIKHLENEVDRLQAELAHWKANLAHWKANHDAQAARNAVLRDRTDLSPEQWAERFGYKGDAERYRWLRHELDVNPPLASVVWKGNGIRDSDDWRNFGSSDQLDAAIDAARRER